MRTPAGSRWVSNNYITRCHRRLEFNWSSRQAEFSSSYSHSSSSSRSWRQVAVVRASASQRAWAFRTPVEQPSRMRKECCYNTEELGVNMWQSVTSPTHLSHIININPFATLSRIKCERYIFLKKCFRSSLLLIMFPCIVVYVLCGYTTGRLRGCPRGVMVKALDCGIVVSEFVFQSCYYVDFRANTLGKGMNPLILPAMFF